MEADRKLMMTMSRRNLLATLSGLLGTKLTLQPDSAAAEEGAFPADFVWGASTSSYQIEGAVDADEIGRAHV